MQNVDASAPAIKASKQVLNKQQEVASKALDEAVRKTAEGIRSGSKALARVSQDPEVQKEFAITVEKVGDALAAVAENSGEITADMVEKFGPAFKQYVFAASDMVQNAVFDVAMGAVGAIPVVGDVASTAGQVLDSGNENGWRSFWATYKAVPHAVDIAGRAVTNASANAQVGRETNQQLQKMTNAFNNVAKAVEMETAAGAKGKRNLKNYNHQLSLHQLPLHQLMHRCLEVVKLAKNSKKNAENAEKNALKKRHANINPLYPDFSTISMN